MGAIHDYDLYDRDFEAWRQKGIEAFQHEQKELLALTKRTDAELIDIVMNHGLDYDIRIEASKEVMRRTGVVQDG